MDNTRKCVTIVSKKDLDISYFCGSGPGGQKKNKTASGVQITHRESGAIGRASDTRSQHQNKLAAFVRMSEHPKFKFWLARKLYEMEQGEKLEATIERDMALENLKFEIKDENGKWIEVSSDYFQTDVAQTE